MLFLYNNYTTCINISYVLGLMISGCAKVSQSLADDTYASRASETVKFLRNHMYNADSGKLLRSAYVGENKEIVQM